MTPGLGFDSVYKCLFFSLPPGMTLRMITVNYPPQKNISETSITVLMSFSVIRQSLMILDLWSRYQIE